MRTISTLRAVCFSLSTLALGLAACQGAPNSIENVEEGALALEAMNGNTIVDAASVGVGFEVQMVTNVRSMEDPLVLCGDGNVDLDEQCDDGNTTSGDGCSDSCQSESPETVTGACCVSFGVCKDALTEAQSSSFVYRQWQVVSFTGFASIMKSIT